MIHPPCNFASPEAFRAIARIEPSFDGTQFLRPCRATLQSGEVIERLLCREERRGFRTDGWIHPDDLVTVEESPLRLPAPFANLVYGAGETGMGYEVFTLRFRGGTEQVFVTGNLVDFPDYPGGLGAADVLEALPHVGLEATRLGNYRTYAPFKVCYFMRSGG